MPVEFQISYDLTTYCQSLVLLLSLAVMTSFFACRDVIKSKVAENLTYA